MAELKREWIIWAVACAALLAVAAWGLYSMWGSQMTLLWLLAAGGLMLYQLAYLYIHLNENRDISSGRLYQRLGPANWLTVGRGGLLALVAGFLLVPRPEGWMAWVPAVLYSGAMLIDFGDGYVARITGMVTNLGSRLDMHIDAHGYFIGGLLIVLWGQAPAWYLLVPLAWPLYVTGEWVFARQNKPLRALYPNPFRRPLAGAQMGFSAVLLFPVFTPPGTTIAAAVFTLPFLINFLLDWLWVSGMLPVALVQPGERRSRVFAWLRAWVPLGLRALLVAFLIWRAQQPGLTGAMAELYQLLHGLIILAIITGSAGRVFAVAAMLLSGFYLRTSAADGLAWGILLAGLGIFFSGTGRFSLWTPEDWLIYRIAGEKAEA
jgi:CDP-diacylglycerol---glycerol-3-phosphate 3-phosphatidyltransferase